MENQHFQWVNPLFRLGHGFNSYVTVITRGFAWGCTIFWIPSECGPFGGARVTMVAMRWAILMYRIPCQICQIFTARHAVFVSIQKNG
jgi:hypothetical protein